MPLAHMADGIRFRTKRRFCSYPSGALILKEGSEMRTARARVEALETRLAEVEKGPKTMFVTFVSPGATGPITHDPIAVRNGSGWQLAREPGEDLQVFRDRAELACPRPTVGAAVLVDVLERERSR